MNKLFKKLTTLALVFGICFGLQNIAYSQTAAEKEKYEEDCKDVVVGLTTIAGGKLGGSFGAATGLGVGMYIRDEICEYPERERAEPPEKQSYRDFKAAKDEEYFNIPDHLDL